MQRSIPTIIKGIEHWKCPACTAKLPMDAFYVMPWKPSGRSSRCKRCYGEQQNEWRAKNRPAIRAQTIEQNGRARKADPARFRAYRKKHDAKYPEKKRARVSLKSAIKAGRILKPSACEKCGVTCVAHGHHPDYSKPLKVMWLCPLCHRTEHHIP